MIDTMLTASCSPVSVFKEFIPSLPKVASAQYVVSLQYSPYASIELGDMIMDDFVAKPLPEHIRLGVHFHPGLRSFSFCLLVTIGQHVPQTYEVPLYQPLAAFLCADTDLWISLAKNPLYRIPQDQMYLARTRYFSLKRTLCDVPRAFPSAVRNFLDELVAHDIICPCPIPPPNYASFPVYHEWNYPVPVPQQTRTSDSFRGGAM
jgi:hypothetical protein